MLAVRLAAVGLVASSVIGCGARTGLDYDLPRAVPGGMAGRRSRSGS